MRDEQLNHHQAITSQKFFRLILCGGARSDNYGTNTKYPLQFAKIMYLQQLHSVKFNVVDEFEIWDSRIYLLLLQRSFMFGLPSPTPFSSSISPFEAILPLCRKLWFDTRSTIPTHLSHIASSRAHCIMSPRSSSRAREGKKKKHTHPQFSHILSRDSKNGKGL